MYYLKGYKTEAGLQQSLYLKILALKFGLVQEGDIGGG